MLPLFKVISVVLRVFCRPLINATKKYHAQRKHQHPFFVWVGLKYHYINSYVDALFLRRRMNAPPPISPLVAANHGIELSYQILFYFIVLGFPIYQMFLGSIEAEEKSKKMQERLIGVQTILSSIQQSIIVIEQTINNNNVHITVIDIFTDQWKSNIQQKQKKQISSNSTINDTNSDSITTISIITNQNTTNDNTDSNTNSSVTVNSTNNSVTVNSTNTTTVNTTTVNSTTVNSTTVNTTTVNSTTTTQNTINAISHE